MAQVDTSIYGRREPVRLLDPMEQAARADMLQRNALAREQQEMQVDAARRDVARQAELRNMLAGGKRGAALEDELVRGGFLEQAATYGKTRRENEKLERENRDKAIDRQIKIHTRAAQMLNGANDQASWDLAIRFMESMADDEEDIKQISQVPREFDPRVRDMFANSVMTVAEQLNQRRQMERLQLDAANQPVNIGANGQPAINPLALGAKQAIAAAGAQGQSMPIQWKEVTNPDGSTTLVPVPAEVRPGQALPSPVAAGFASGKATEKEKGAAGFLHRMRKVEAELSKFPNGAPNEMTSAAGAIPWMGTYLQRRVMTPEQQQYKNLADDWIRAKLRNESGAVIGADEMRSEYELYFPQPGDTPDLIEQKKARRKEAERQMELTATNALPMMNRPAPTAPAAPAAPARAPATPAAPAAGGFVIKSVRPAPPRN